MFCGTNFTAFSVPPKKERDRRSGPVSQILPSLQSFLLIQLMTKVVRNTIP